MAEKSPVQSAKSGTVTAPTPAEKMLRKMAGMAVTNIDERKTSIDDLNVILEASDEEFWDSDDRLAISARSLSGCVIDIRGIEVRFGEGSVGDEDITSPFIDPETRKQMYLMVEAAMIDKRQQLNKMLKLPETGDVFQFNTSARFVVAKLMSAHNRGWLDNGKPPLRVRVVGTALSGKRRVEKLKPADAPYVAASVAPNGDSASEDIPF